MTGTKRNRRKRKHFQSVAARTDTDSLACRLDGNTAGLTQAKLAIS